MFPDDVVDHHPVETPILRNTPNKEAEKPALTPVNLLPSSSVSSNLSLENSPQDNRCWRTMSSNILSFPAIYSRESGWFKDSLNEKNSEYPRFNRNIELDKLVDTHEETSLPSFDEEPFQRNNQPTAESKLTPASRCMSSNGHKDIETLPNFFSLRLPTLPHDSHYYDSIDDEYAPLNQSYSSDRTSAEGKTTTVGTSRREDSFHDVSSNSSFCMEPSHNVIQPGQKVDEEQGLAESLPGKNRPILLDRVYKGHGLPTVSPQRCLDSNGHYTQRVNEDFRDEDEELSELLIGQRVSPSYAENWNSSAAKRDTDTSIKYRIEKERLQGVTRIHSQLSQAAQVFRELAHLINDQQEDLDFLDHSVLTVKNSTIRSVEELRKANERKKRARRRKFTLFVVAGILALFTYFVYFSHSTTLMYQPMPLVPRLTGAPLTSNEHFQVSNDHDRNRVIGHQKR